ncbi:MAG TPA: KR domain-containing protein [Alcanivorax sp.]|jgi:short-subunit dehydrogenase|uniref:Ketoacyl reductase n=1 Tax=Alcanivorax jadensis T9 TaxID=1177181 RepID=A0ABR4WA87_9GAMM|nr:MULTISPECIES: SDR family NAD(P)-dependent oxidoreductase [Alcanivorax]KGD60326.1 ketoacyl reductase [Alcanivorax jadensis T9]MAC15039.1 short-chain dehydrogenase [Alcanivorax sp.]MBG33241.1 short-chain dehydrogenase [Alcanivorax sp.]MBP22355.1 short-chain dehydrogenase [Alcanivorax sp.]MDF1636489.1 SDR family NAD(P)-dependent oxidoreductase [Alcanivorax jadensis]|tara:strand:+ start:2503 stop:3309 length:807 start_codon:yes stop_codon:yes gene_type:complete
MTKTVLITGGAGGIGREFCKLFNADDYRIIVFSLLQEELDALGNDLKAQRPDVEYHAVQMDLSQPGAAEAIMQWLDQQQLDVDVLVNNVGFGMMGEHVEQDSQTLERMLTLNNILLSKLCMLVGARMKARGEGKIMNIGSLAGFCPMPFFAAYSASKAFVINFSASLHEELKPYGVQVTCFCPSTTKTAFLDTAESNHKSSSGIREFVSAQIATPEAVAKAGYQALNKGKRYALPGLSVTLQSIWIRIMPLRAMANFVYKQSIKEMER